VCQIGILTFGIQAPVTPAGWTLVPGMPGIHGIVYNYLYTRNARTTDGETGSQTFTIAAGNGFNIGRIYRFRNVEDVGTFIESISTSGNDTGTITGPTITPTGAGRLGVIFSTAFADTVATVITGETGGTWIDKAQWASAALETLDLQTVALEPSVAVAGGSGTIGGGTVAVQSVAFALIGNVD
jgi:hypothetical protein